MDFWFYLIAFIVGYFLGAFSGSNIFLSVFLSIPLTKELYKKGEMTLELKEATMQKITTTIIIHTFILVFITFIAFFVANQYILAYIIGLIVPLFFVKSKSTDNFSDYKNNYLANNSTLQKDFSPSDIDIMINDLVGKSGLSKQICSDIYNTLIFFSAEKRETAYNYIEEKLIPNLQNENNIANVGIAFGMLITDYALSKEEADGYSVMVINKIYKENNKEN